MAIVLKFSILIMIMLIALLHLYGSAAYPQRYAQVSGGEKEEKQNKSNIFTPSAFSSSFNNGQYQYIAGGIRVFAKRARDPGVYFETLIKNISDYKYFVFDIKGNLDRLGQWCFPVVQIYDIQDDDYTPSITKTSFTFNNNEFTTIVVPLEGRIKTVSKIQFMLVTDRGSWDVNVVNARFE
ncbi:hypothetical protein ACFLZ2_04025 [Candidatus Margulisiibacteriota bacterium]